MLAALLAAADTIKDEPSKTPFYICGGALAALAFVVSAAGIRRHGTFPPSATVGRALIALFVLLVAAAMATAVATA